MTRREWRLCRRDLDGFIWIAYRSKRTSRLHYVRVRCGGKRHV
jgi:hypothetical protein